MKSNSARPFLKWAGGKSKLLKQLEVYYNVQLNSGKIKRYIEPFLGGGAVFFELQSKFNFEEIILNDINEEVILTYNIIKREIDELIYILKELEDNYLSLEMEDKEKMYYDQRNKFNEEKFSLNYHKLSNPCISHSARMIFLNKTCFNGLYRQNRKGQFNVPFGKRKKVTICDSENLQEVNKALKNVILKSGDFELLTNFVDEDTFLYLDPPYRPLNTTSSFTDYSKIPFNDESQKRLAMWIRKLDSIGASFLLSNSDPTNTNPEDTFFDQIYDGFNIGKVKAARAINSNGNKRGQLRELVITNMDDSLVSYKHIELLNL